MGKTPEEQHLLAQQIGAAQTKITVGADYWHHKSRDKVYTVLGLGFTEATNELCVIYQAQYGETLTFLRPLTSWLEMVEWQGQIVPRFTKL